MDRHRRLEPRETSFEGW
ncbi:hypothetical protein ECMA6_2573, partial [Escherichia coli MA6]